MVFGMSLATYTAVHVIISLIGIASGLIVLAVFFAASCSPCGTVCSSSPRL